jgi:hypothetical protein
VALRCRLYIGAVVLALGLLVGSCTKSEPPQATPPPSTAAQPPPSTAAQPTSSSPSATPKIRPTEAAAIARAQGYVAVLDKLSSNPKATLDELSTVARGKAVDKWRQIIFDDRSAGRRQTGSTKLTLLSAKAGSSDQQWVVTMCLDVSGVDVVDRDGKSVVSKDRPDRVRDVLTVDQDTSSSKWYVTQDKVTGTC